MCHVLLALPVISLVLFAVLPFWEALFVYGLILFLCAILFWLIVKDMMRPATTGIQGMIGGTGQVRQNGTGPAKVFYNGEIWDVVQDKKLAEGDMVQIEGIEGMKLIVRPKQVVGGTKFAE